MKNWTLLLLRVSLGWLLVVWGADKIFNVEHGMVVANKFYFGFLATGGVLQAAGALQVLLGLAVVLGVARLWTYPAQLLLNGASLLAVMQSVVDPWSWFFDGGNPLFYPSLIIFAGSLLLLAYRDEDRLVLEKRRDYL